MIHANEGEAQGRRGNLETGGKLSSRGKLIMGGTPQRMFHLPVRSQVAMTLWAVLLMSESLSRLKSQSASQILSSSLSGLPSQIMWRMRFLMRASSSGAISKTLSQKTSMSFWTLQGQSCLTASNRTSASAEWVYSRMTSMSSVERQMDMSSFLLGSLTPLLSSFFLLSLPFLINYIALLPPSHLRNQFFYQLPINSNPFWQKCPTVPDRVRAVGSDAIFSGEWPSRLRFERCIDLKNAKQLSCGKGQASPLQLITQLYIVLGGVGIMMG